MGGKTSQSTQQVTIPPEVLQRYNAANDAAAAAASRPFQSYSSDPSAFVAPMSSTQNAGVAGTNAAAGMAQPYFGQATGQLNEAQRMGAGMTGSAQTALLNAKNRANTANVEAGNYYTGAYAGAQPYNQVAGGLIGQGVGAAQPLNSTAETGYTNSLAGAQPYNQVAAGLAAASASAVNPSNLDSASIEKYLSPYLSTVMGGTAAQLNQDNQRAMSGQTGSAMAQGAFGGDRAGLAAANLQRQQQLANAQIYSGILNQGYGQALGAAQQQQGVGLEAGQANRAALGSAAGQLAGIGQQQYAQGTGTAAQQAALGQQEFGQGLGAASAVQGLGQQVYGQGMGEGQAQQGLGAQAFGQGVTTSQQEAALAQQQYGMGANTAQQLAGLGAGSQTAALQGAQAQLGAGQVQQQTEQAGKTALYNQFLQQQSYPFQTAQFLANVAEGTGALSGSTTTTTQPGGFFSDRRLKEDIRKIGETYDGQVIYSFKYKGVDRTQIGLMAQDVEKEHPDAVGAAQGWKTVDYGKATKDAVKRGHFSRGGLSRMIDGSLQAPLVVGFGGGDLTPKYGEIIPIGREAFAEGGTSMLPGISSADMAALLAAQEGMYAPFGQQGGLYGGQAGGLPRGGSSYVPQANLPVAHLTVAGGIAPQKSGAESAKDYADVVTKLAPYAKKAGDWMMKGHNDNSSNADQYEVARGGLIPAKRYASGGMPYADSATSPQLDIPDETPTAKLQTAGDLSGQKTGMDNTKTAAETALAVAKLAAMFMNRGGRAGFAGGGVPGVDMTALDDPNADYSALTRPSNLSGSNLAGATAALPPPTQPDHVKFADSTVGHILGSMGLLGGGQDTAKEAQIHAAAADRQKQDAAHQQNIMAHFFGGDIPMSVPATPTAPQASMADMRRLTTPTTTPHAAHMQHHHTAGGLGASAPSQADVFPGASAPTPPPETTADAMVHSAAPPITNSPDLQQAPNAPPPPGLMDRLGAAASGPLGGLSGAVGRYGEGLKRGDSQQWLPLLSAIAAAGTAPTVHPGVALAAGLGAGTQSYMGVKKQLADIARTEAGTGVIEAPEKSEGYTWVPGRGPNGEGVVGKDGKTVWHRILNVNATDYGPTASTPQAAALAKATGAAPVSQPPSPTTAPSPQTVADLRSKYQFNEAQPGVANYERAIALHPELAAQNEAAKASVQARIGDQQANDVARRQILQLSAAVNSLSPGVTGQGHGAVYRTNLNNFVTTAAQMVGLPVSDIMRSDLENQQLIQKVRELAGIQLAKEGNQRSGMVAQAIVGVLPSGEMQPGAANKVIAQQLVNLQQTRDLQGYANNYVTQSHGVMFGVEPAFEKDTGQTYEREEQNLADFMQSPKYGQAIADLHSSDPAVRNKAIYTIDHVKGPNFHRYFTGGQ